MDKEQVKDIAKDCGLVVGQHWNRSNMTTAFMLDFANAAIESYKAELLKGVGESVAYINPNNRVAIESAKKWADRKNSFSITAFTSDQVAAAIIKATKPLGEEVERLKVDRAKKQKESVTIFDANCDLRSQLAVAQEEIRRLEKIVLSAQNAAIENGVALKSTQDQLAKAEQRVAEACALQVATETKFHWLDAARVAKEIRSGEWRKFLKEV